MRRSMAMREEEILRRLTSMGTAEGHNYFGLTADDSSGVRCLRWNFRPSPPAILSIMENIVRERRTASASYGLSSTSSRGWPCCDRRNPAVRTRPYMVQGYDENVITAAANGKCQDDGVRSQQRVCAGTPHGGAPRRRVAKAFPADVDTSRRAVVIHRVAALRTVSPNLRGQEINI